MSIFGNKSDTAQWQRAERRGLGLTFLFIDLYTRFFECFWDSIHKAAFFAVLAVSFWCIGRRAEALWHFGERRLQSDSGEKTNSSGGCG